MSRPGAPRPPPSAARRARRQQQQLRAAPASDGARAAAPPRDHVRVGAADAEASSRRRAAAPRRAATASQPVDDAERACASKSIFGFGARSAASAGAAASRSASAVLITPAAPAAITRWPTLLLTEPMPQKPVSAVCAPEGLGQRLDLDRVAERRRGAVRLDVARCVRASTPADRLRRRDHRGLAVDARRGEAGLVAAVVVDRRAADAPRRSVSPSASASRQPLQHHHRRAVAEHRALRLGVEGAGVAVGREHRALLVEVAAVAAGR